MRKVFIAVLSLIVVFSSIGFVLPKTALANEGLANDRVTVFLESNNIPYYYENGNIKLVDISFGNISKVNRLLQDNFSSNITNNFVQDSMSI